MSERIDKFHSTVKQEMLKAQRAHAKVAAGPWGLLQDHPLIVLFAIGLFTVFLLTASINDSAKNAEELDAWYRAKLDCRLTGGTYEYFGTQGYACIPAPSSSSNRQ